MSEKRAAPASQAPSPPPAPAAAGPAAPAVPASVYSENYYLEWCGGFGEWRDSGGAAMAGFYPGVLRLAGVRAGDRILDVGTGRGEAMAVATSARCMSC